MSCSVRINPNAWIAAVVGSEGIAKSRRALVAKVVLAAVSSRIPFPAFQQHYAKARSRQFLRDNPTCCARAHNHCVHALHERPPFLRSY